jgi:hypothetical protein
MMLWKQTQGELRSLDLRSKQRHIQAWWEKSDDYKLHFFTGRVHCIIKHLNIFGCMTTSEVYVMVGLCV